MGYDVFISYKSDEINEALRVRHSLEKKGISCWMAPDGIPGGSSYAVEIPKAIKECAVFVLVLSHKTQASKWVPKEIDQAINLEKVIMPFMIEDFVLRDDFSFYLSNVQRYNAFESWEESMALMAERILQITGKVSYTSAPTVYGQNTQTDMTAHTVGRTVNHNKPTKRKEKTPEEKRRSVCFILCLFFGWMGAHRYYTGQIFTGIVWHCSFGLFGVGWFFDLIRILMRKFNDKKIKSNDP